MSEKKTYKLKILSVKGTLETFAKSTRITIPVQAAKIMGIDPEIDRELEAELDPITKKLTIWKNEN